jgi:ribosomal protein L7/L12
MLDEVPADKNCHFKIVRSLTGLGLKEAKELVESAPKQVQEGVAKDAAEDAKKQIEAAGGKASCLIYYFHYISNNELHFINLLFIELKVN